MPQAGQADPKQCFRTDGSYNFKMREDWDYRCSYDYMCGSLGQAEVVNEKKRKKKLGTVDMVAPPIPLDSALVETIEKVANHVHSSSEPKAFEHLIKAKNGWKFLDEGGEGYDYYEFCKHCLERQGQPRPLAEKARTVAADREVKQANAKVNAFACGSGEPLPKKEAVFKSGDLLEVLGVKSKPEYNGNIVKVKAYDSTADRYEVVFEGGRFNTVVVKLKEENLMCTMITEQELRLANSKENIPEGELPNGTKVMIHSLQSESARWMNGQSGVIVMWDKETDRYEIRLNGMNNIKKVKPANVKAELPEGWEEHFDEHLGKHYYLNVKTEKVTWKHPAVANTRAQMGKVMEKKDDDLEEYDAEGKRQSKVDKDHVHYDIDDQDEGEGGFDLQALVKKVEEVEARREAAEEAGEEGYESDDGMHKVQKKRKKKHSKEKISSEEIQLKVADLIDKTMVNRATMQKDLTLLEGHFVAQKEMDPVIERLESQLEFDDEPDDEVMRATFEVMLAGLDKACRLLNQLSNNRMQLVETMRVVDRIPQIREPKQLLQDSKWVAALLKTM